LAVRTRKFSRSGLRLTSRRREYQILREELHAAVERRLTRTGAAERTRALRVIDDVLDSAMGGERGVGAVPRRLQSPQDSRPRHFRPQHSRPLSVFR
jgi:hypothetical protein